MEGTAAKSRQNGLDLLRLISAFLVVYGHVFSAYKECAERFAEEGSVTAVSIPTWILYYFRAQNWMIAAFFMLSGAFLLSSKSSSDFPSFYRKTWKKLGIPTLVFSIIYILVTPGFRVMVGVIDDMKMSVGYTIFSAIRGMPAEHMWYMFVLIAIYLLVPFIMLGKEKMGSKAFWTVAVAALIWGDISALIEKPEVFWTLGNAANTVGIVMMGNAIHERIGDKKNARKAAVYIGIGLLLCVPVTWTHVHHTLLKDAPDILNVLCGRMLVFNPTLILAACFIFAGFHYLDIKKDLFSLSELTFYTYLVHPLVMMPVTVFELKVLNMPDSVYGKVSGLVGYMVTSIVVFVLSMLVSKVILSVQGKLKAKKKAAAMQEITQAPAEDKTDKSI